MAYLLRNLIRPTSSYANVAIFKSRQSGTTYAINQEYISWVKSTSDGKVDIKVHNEKLELTNLEEINDEFNQFICDDIKEKNL